MATKQATKPKAEKVLVFAWEGTDKKGNKVKGETNAPNISLVRAELRRQGISARSNYLRNRLVETCQFCCPFLGLKKYSW